MKPIKLLHFRRDRLGEDVCTLGRRARHVDGGGEEALNVDGKTGACVETLVTDKETCKKGKKKSQ